MVKFCLFLKNLFICVYYLCLCIVYINCSVFSFFLIVRIWWCLLIFVLLFFLFAYLHVHLYIYIYIIIKIIFLYKIVKENVQNKSTKVGTRTKNLCMLNDFKESVKIVFETESNIPNNEIRSDSGWIIFFI